MNEIFNVRTFQLQDGTYIARAYVGDAPAYIGTIKYGDTPEEAKKKLEDLIISRGKRIAT